MKKMICLMLTFCMFFAFAACGDKKAEAELKEWTRQGFFMDENENMLSVTWMDDVDEPGWYVGVVLGEDWIEDAWGGMLPQEGSSLYGTLPSSGSKSDLTVTVSEEGEDGLLLTVEGGETYHFKGYEMPEATVIVTVNTEGWGYIAYAEGEEAPEIDTEYPSQSAYIGLAEPAVHTFIAWPQAGNVFVKWTKNGEDFSTEPQFTALLDESAEYVAVFEEDPGWQNPVMNFIGEYQCDRAHATVMCSGFEDAWITIQWGSSAWELTQWDIFGTLNTDTLTINYSGCTKSNIVYDDNGEVKSQEPEYEGGTGTIVFNDNGTFTWHEDQSESGEDMVFERLPFVYEIDYLALVNKLNPLPDGWEDAIETVTITNSVGDEVEVEAKAYAAYELLKADLEENSGIYLELDSARRSVAAQQDIMDRFIEKYGADYASKTVAQPGYSEHHTGLALDLYFKIRNENGSFTDVYYNEDMEKPEYTWIWDAIHAKLADYGFILRYLAGEEHITGYRYEPWHIRYLDSVEIAREIMSQPGMTLEEYLAGQSSPEVMIDLSGSTLYTEDELYDAMLAIKCKFASWAGCELHSIRYAGDKANSEENLAWLNSLVEGSEFTQATEFLMNFHSPVEDGPYSWEPDTEYTDYQWWLARTENGDWEIVSWGY